MEWTVGAGALLYTSAKVGMLRIEYLRTMEGTMDDERNKRLVDAKMTFSMGGG